MNNIDLTLSDNTSVVDLMADVDLTIEAKQVGDEADFCDVVRDVVLARCDGKAKLQPGAYNIRMLCIVTRNEEQQHVDKADQLPRQPTNQDVSGTSQED